MSYAPNGPEAYFENNPDNGAGYTLYQPALEPYPNTSLDDVVKSLTFPYSTFYISAVDAALGSNLAIEGCPGAGKSHLTKDLIIASIGLQRPVFALKTHIAFGKKNAMDSRAEDMLEFIDGQKQKPLVILDNVDFLGYKGSHRTKPNAEKALDTYGRVIRSLVDSPSVSVIGIIHTLDWRETHWSEGWPDISQRATDIIEDLGDPVKFNGEMDYKRARRHMARIGIDSERAKRLLNAVQSVTGELLFRHVHHLDRHLSAVNDEGGMRRRSDDEQAVARAIKSIDAGTRQKLKFI